jgi:hypothetical protein
MTQQHKTNTNMARKTVITISLPEPEHKWLKTEAKRQKRSMSSIVRERCFAGMDGRETPADLQAILDGQKARKA